MTGKLSPQRARVLAALPANGESRLLPEVTRVTYGDVESKHRHVVRTVLYWLREQGFVEQESRGAFRRTLLGGALQSP